MSMAVMLTGDQTYQRTDGHAYGQPGAYPTYMCGKYRPIAIHEKTKKQLHIHYKSERHTASDVRRATSDERRTTSDERLATSDKRRRMDYRRMTSDQRRTTIDERRATDDEQRTIHKTNKQTHKQTN